MAAENRRRLSKLGNQPGMRALEAIDVLWLLTNDEGRIIDSSSSWRKAAVGGKDVSGKKLWELVSDEDQSRLEVVFKGVVKSRKEGGTRVTCTAAPADLRQMMCRIQPLALSTEEPDTYLVVAVDATELHRNEADLRRRVSQQAAVAQLGLDALTGHDLQALMDEAVELLLKSLQVEFCKILQLAPGGKELFLRAGYGWRNPAEIRVSADPRTQAGFTLGSDEPVVVQDLQKDKRFSGPPLLNQHKVRSGMSVVIQGEGRAFGVLGIHSTSTRSFTVEDANFLQAVANILGGAIQKDSFERRLRRSEKINRAIVENSVEGIIAINDSGIILSLNAAAEKIFGYSAEEAVGRNVSILMPKEDAARHDDYIANYLRTGKAQIIGIGRELMGRRKDGSLFPMYLGVGEVVDRRRLFVGTVRDLTETKRIAAELQRARDFAVLGEMATAVAHQIKNPLAAISGVVQVLRDDPASDESHREVLGQLLERVEGLDNTVRSLLRFAKPWNVERAPFDVKEVVKSLLNSAAEDPRLQNVQLELKGDGAFLAAVDLILIQDVFWNLFYNAAEAMEGGGRLVISFSREAGAVVVQVSDSGPGIPEQDLPKVFRPFFTTKGAGTGLGLAICRKIMEAHEGRITIESRPGQGTCVTLRFPAVRERTLRPIVREQEV